MNGLPNCKQAHLLMVAAQDRSLSLMQRVTLRLHLLMCLSCTRFSKQLIFIRAALRGMSDVAGGDNRGDPPPKKE